MGLMFFLSCCCKISWLICFQQKISIIIQHRSSTKWDSTQESFIMHHFTFTISTLHIIFILCRSSRLCIDEVWWHRELSHKAKASPVEFLLTFHLQDACRLWADWGNHIMDPVWNEICLEGGWPRSLGKWSSRTSVSSCCCCCSSKWRRAGWVVSAEILEIHSTKNYFSR